MKNLKNIATLIKNDNETFDKNWGFIFCTKKYIL